EDGREGADLRRERGLAGDVHDYTLAPGDARELREEVGHIARRERAGVARPRDVRVRLSREHVRVEGDGDRLVALEHALRTTKTVLERDDVVDHNAALAELGLELRDDIHAVLAHVLERGVADR